MLSQSPPFASDWCGDHYEKTRSRQIFSPIIWRRLCERYKEPCLGRQYRGLETTTLIGGECLGCSPPSFSVFPGTGFIRQSLRLTKADSTSSHLQRTKQSSLLSLCSARQLSSSSSLFASPVSGSSWVFCSWRFKERLASPQLPTSPSNCFTPVCGCSRSATTEL